MDLEAKAENVFTNIIVPHLQSKTMSAVAFGVVKNGHTVVKFGGKEAVHGKDLTRGHYFDLASLTKVLFTTSEILKLIEKNTININAPFRDYLPDFMQQFLHLESSGITIHELLTHTTGLVPVCPIYTYGNDPLTLRHFIIQNNWTRGKHAYSDINFLLLGFLLERLSGKKLSELTNYENLGFRTQLDGNFVSTEFCHWRQEMLNGKVHDENCYSLGGETGHAGFFGNIDGVLSYLKDFLNYKIINQNSMQLIKDTNINGRSIGWEKQTNSVWATDSTHEDMIGHTGFTGTAIWVDFRTNSAFTLLTNRVHPSRHNQQSKQIAKLRGQIVDRMVG